ncbi:FliH/SctL family protein [Pontivivens nitratireducens]|uniref:FliH/SctL family protein n=1 Tax=Pontivivens nitratireducens TaxID=2758038 RepID=UPI00163B538A|nr:FliH/SctL family protein [Pontibrevibacter nitratireducens]
MSARLFRLDDIERPAAAAAATEPVCGEQLRKAYDEGYAKGFTDAATRAAEAATQQSERVTTAIFEAVSDAQITMQSARATAEADLLDLISEIARTALSDAAARDFSEQVATAVRHELDLAPGTSITVSLCPEEAGMITEAIPEGIVIRSEPDLSPGCATIATDSGLTKLDISAVLARISQTLSPNPTQEPEYDQRNHA